MSAATDTTEALRVAERTMRDVQRVAHLGTWTWHVTTGELEWSDEMFRIFGVDRDTVSGGLAAVIAQAIHPDDRDAVERINRSVLEEAKPVALEYRVCWPDGSIRHVRAEAAELVRDAEGRPLRLLGVVLDITERKRAEEALRRSEEKFSKALQAAPIAMSMTRERDRKLLDVNEAWLRLFGFTREEVVGRTSRELGIWVEPEDRSRLSEEVASGGIEGRECHLRTKAGALITAVASIQPVELDGETCMLATVKDTTARKAAELALGESQATLAAALGAMTDAVFVSDASGKLLHFNDAYARFNRFASKAECLRTFAEYPDLFETSSANGELSPVDMWAVPRALRGETATNEEYRVRRRDTNESWVGSYSFGPIRNEAGVIVGSVVIARDVTAEKRAEHERAMLEAQLQQTHKMESIGRLAGGVAHDFNNMLGVILGHTEVALESTDEKDTLHEDLCEIRDAAQRSAELTRQLLGFARRQAVAPKLVNMNDAVEGMLPMLRRLIGENVRLEWRAGKNPWPVRIDPSQVDQLLTNLAANARAAIADVGTLWLETGNRTLDADFCAEHAEIVPGEYVSLMFRDDGCGMDKETVDRVFEPFFTTKPVGEGTGLGLATVYGIIRQNDGFIDVSSKVGQGSTFILFFPRHVAGAEEPARSAAPAPAPTPTLHGHETVLIVEDEESVLRVTKKLLELTGYKVLSASGPAVALRIASEHCARIDLLITDIVMPDMNGRDLAKALSARDPRMKCLFMSGYAAGSTSAGTFLQGERFVQKPFSLKDLAAKVRDILDH